MHGDEAAEPLAGDVDLQLMQGNGFHTPPGTAPVTINTAHNTLHAT